MLSKLTSSIVGPGRRAIILLAALAVLLVPIEASATPHRTILRNGKIFTADPAQPWAQAIAIQDDKILDVGGDAAVMKRANPGTTVIDLHGRTVVPGLNDAHVHVLTPGGVPINAPSFIPGPGPTLGELLGTIQAATQAYPPGTWLVAYVGTNVTDDENANRFALDAVSPDHPVRLMAWWGHGTIINTKAMEVLGISPDAPNPFGGFYEHDEDSGTLDGVVHEYAEWRIWRKLYGQLPDAEAVQRYQAFAGAALQYGFTSLQDMAVGLPHTRSASILGAANLPLRVRSICFPLTPDELCVASNPDDDSLTHFSGIKWVTDGTPLERLALMEHPYQDRPGLLGSCDLGGALDNILFRSLLGPRKTHQILFHAVGDGAIERILGGLEDLGGSWIWGNRRPRIEHGDLLFPENIQRVADLGVVVVQNGTHLGLTSVFQQRYGAERVAQMEPLRSLLDAGIPLALGTDGIGAPQSPWLDIFLTAVHPTHPGEAISVEEAITAYTRGSAYAEFQETRKGTLAQGKLADLAVLSQDVFSVPLPALPATTSVLTMVGGHIVWDAGALSH